jgi:hypothetical protein
VKTALKADRARQEVERLEAVVERRVAKHVDAIAEKRDDEEIQRRAGRVAGSRMNLDRARERLASLES